MSWCGHCKHFDKPKNEKSGFEAGWCNVPMPFCVSHDSKIYSYQICSRTEATGCSWL